MNRIEIKKINGDLIFSYEQENNTVKKTLEKANLSGTDLSDAYLSGTDLRGANLRGANLSGTDLSDAYLRDANLSGTDLSDIYLRGTYLRGTYLRGTDLRGTDLSGTDLRGANLRGANLSGTDLSGANLSDTNLNGTNLNGTNLNGTNLNGTDLRGANLRGAKNIPQSYINTCSRDMLYIFYTLKAELPQLREKLVKGEINGSQYDGSCGCLIVSLANIKNIKLDEFCKSLLPHYDMGLHNLNEQWFYQIHNGDTPKNNFFAKHAVKLIDEVLLTNTGKSQEKADYDWNES